MKQAFSLLFLMLCLSAAGQQKPHYTQYILNQYIINPALTGIENYIDVKISHRHQWVGVNDAPVTTYITIHAPLNKKGYQTNVNSYRVPGENPRGTNYWEQYSAAHPHHGIGLTVLNDRTGPLNRFSTYATYAYHIGISSKTSLAAGFGAGFSNLSLNSSKLFFGDPYTVDPAVYGTGEVNNIRPDFNAGLWLYSSTYFVGLAAQQIIPQTVTFAEKSVSTLGGKFVPHLFSTAGYRFLLTDDFNVMPSVMVKYIKPLPLQADFNIKVQYLDLVWAGASFRTRDGFAAMVGMNVSNTFNIGYSYDLTTSKLNTVSRGTHEIIVGFLIGNKYGDWCPRNVW